MPFCTNCGANNLHEGRFCTKCGSTLTTVAATVAPAADTLEPATNPAPNPSWRARMIRALIMAVAVTAVAAVAWPLFEGQYGYAAKVTRLVTSVNNNVSIAENTYADAPKNPNEQIDAAVIANTAESLGAALDGLEELRELRAPEKYRADHDVIADAADIATRSVERLRGVFENVDGGTWRQVQGQLAAISIRYTEDELDTLEEAREITEEIAGVGLEVIE